MSYDVEDQHLAAAQARLLEQYRALPNFNALLAAIVARVQSLEYAIEAVALARPLSAAQGAQLDALGTLIGLARSGLDDATYVTLLRGIISLNNSDASVESLENVVKQIFQASLVSIVTPNSAYHLRRATPAQLSLAVVDPQTPRSLNALLLSLTKQAIAAGVALTQLDVYTAQGTKTFAFAGSQPWVAGFSAGKFAVNLFQNRLD